MYMQAIGSSQGVNAASEPISASQICATPSSTNSSLPVTKLESLDARKRAAKQRVEGLEDLCLIPFLCRLNRKDLLVASRLRHWSVTHRSGLLGQPSRDVLDGIAVESPVEFAGDETDMRRGQDVIQ